MTFTDLLPLLAALVMAYVGIINARNSGSTTASKQSAAITDAWLEGRQELAVVRQKINDLEKRQLERHEAVNRATGLQMEAETEKNKALAELKIANEKIKALEAENRALKIERDALIDRLSTQKLA